MSATFLAHGSFVAQPGKADELEELLLRAAEMLGEQDPRCLLYLVSRSEEQPDNVWVTEVWTDAGAHAASLENPDTRALIAEARPLIAGLGGSEKLRLAGGKGA